jgi:hypothetical protein
VTNIFGGMSGQSRSFARWSTVAGEPSRVADHEGDLAILQLDDVVEVAAHLAGRPVVGRDLPAREIGELARKEVLLDQPGDLELVLDALPLACLSLLLAHELADTQRRCGLRGEVVEQTPIVGRVVLIGEPRSEVEQADQLTLADERDDEPYAGRSQCRERRRVELEAIDVDRPGGALEVRDERVVGRDVEVERVRCCRPGSRRPVWIRRLCRRLLPCGSAQDVG